MLSWIYNKNGIAIYKELCATLNIGMLNKDTMLFLGLFLVIYAIKFIYTWIPVSSTNKIYDD